jgi:hypothetical protein
MAVTAPRGAGTESGLQSGSSAPHQRPGAACTRHTSAKTARQSGCGRDSLPGVSSTDDRRVYRIVVDVLATDAQVDALKDVIGEALCAAPGDHAGPCRIAWTLANTSEDGDGVSYGLGAEEVAFIREFLSPVEVWAPEDVDRSLGV